MIRFVYRHDITIDLVVWREHVGAAKDVSACQTLHDKRTRSAGASHVQHVLDGVWERS